MKEKTKSEPRTRIANVVRVGRNGSKAIGQIDQHTGKPIGGTAPKAKASKAVPVSAPAVESDR